MPRQTRPPIALLLGLALAGPVTAPLAAQPPPDDTLAVQIIWRGVEERWIHEDRQADFVPWEETTEAVELRQILPEPSLSGNRFWDASIGATDADVMLDSIGRFRSLHVRPPGLRYSSGRNEAFELRRNRIRRLQGDTEVLRLPSSPFRDLWLPLPTAPLSPGEAWINTVSFLAEPGEGLTESYHAVRNHRVVGDTVIDGRSVPWIRTEADVRYQASHLEVLLYDIRAVDRELTGRTVAVMAVDTATGLRLAGVDSSHWEGRAVLHDPVSGPWRSDVRFQRMRTWTWYDNAGYQAFEFSIALAMGDTAEPLRSRGSTSPSTTGSPSRRPNCSSRTSTTPSGSGGWGSR